MKIIFLFLLVGLFSMTLTAANPKVTMETSMGKIVVELYQDKAPLTVKNFLTYTNEGFYDATIFHRVIDGFMIQCGGFDTKNIEKDTHATIKNEANNGLTNDRGTLAMARTGDPHSASSQFFISLVDNTFLNFKSESSGRTWGYAVFGKVIEGMDVIDKIAKVETGSHGPHADWPKEPVILKKVSVTK